MGQRYIRVSDVNTFMFCRRALHLQRRGAPSSLGRVRDQGTALHREHGELVRGSGRNWGVAAVLAVIAAALLMAALLASLGS